MADIPISLDEPMELVGKWFEPGAEERVGSGRLLFDPVAGLRLEMVSDLPVILGVELPIMLGITVDGRLVTLRHVHRLHQGYHSRGAFLTQASAGTAFVGLHASTESELRFHSIEARLSHLNEWCYLSGIDLANSVFPRAGTLTFKPPDPLMLARTRGAIIAVSFDFDGDRVPERADRPYKVALAQQARLLIRPARRWAYDDFDELLMWIRWFFGFAAGAQDQLLELRAEATVPTQTMGRGRAPVWIVFRSPSLFSPEFRAAKDMLFCRADLPANELQRPLTRWLSLCRRLAMEPVFGPYFAALATGKMYSDLRFLIYAQAAEAYHARRVPATRQRPVHLRTRIELLVKAMPRALRASMPTTFADEVTVTRNFGTHRDERSRARAATGMRLFALAELLKLTFDVAILRELGFSQSRIAALIDRNSHVDGMRRRALEMLDETTPGRPPRRLR